MRTRPALLAVLSVLALGSCVARPVAPVRPPGPQDLTPTYPAAHWERIEDPAAAGFSASKLEEIRAGLGHLDTTSMMVVVGGRVLLEYGDVSHLSYLASVRKSVLALLYGTYVADGTVKLDESLAALGIDDLGGLSAQEKEATVEDLMTARSGVYHPASNPGDNAADAPARGSQKHGAYFLYNNWDFNVLGTIFEQKTHRGIYEALESDLARPIGAEDFQREAQHKKGDTRASIHLAYHIWLSTRDMARFGLLMLREGKWNDRQLEPRDWVQQITAVSTPREQMNPEKLRKGGFGYGHLWWIFDDDASRAGGVMQGAYTGIGASGQFITVIPKLDMVIAHKTDPAGKHDVSVRNYLGIVAALVDAHCGASCH